MNKKLVSKCESIIKSELDNNTIDYFKFIGLIDTNKDFKTDVQHANAVRFLVEHYVIITENNKISKHSFTEDELNIIENLITTAEQNNMKIQYEVIELLFTNPNRLDIIAQYIDELGLLEITDLENINDFDEEFSEKLVDDYEKSIDNNMLRQYLNEISQFTVLTREEEQDLFTKYIKYNSESAKIKLINSNLRLVVSIAKKYVKDINILLDAIQYGNIGLLSAIDRFNPELGYRFSTYAIWWIKQAITKNIGNDFRNVRLPLHVIDQVQKIKSTKIKLSKILNREPTKNEILDYINKYKLYYSKDIKNLSLKDLQLYERFYDNNKSMVSLYTPVINFNYNSHDDIFIKDVIIDTNSKSPEEHTINSIMYNHIYNVLNRILTTQEIDVITLRYGLYGHNALTLQEIGNKYNVSRERIRQIENRALKKLSCNSLIKSYGKELNFI